MNLALILVTHALMQSASIGQLPVARESADSNKSALRREATTLSGLPGLITAPVAATIPAGMLDIGFSNARTPSAYSGLGTQQSYVIAVGFLPRVSLSLRGTVFGRDANRTADCNCDLSESIQVQLLTEGDWRPSIAVGAQDPLSAARNFETRYVVASKSLLGRLRLTAGYGSGPTVLKGAFGGAEVNVASWATALGEYDGSKYAAALRLQPFPATADWAGVQPRVDVVWRQEFGLSTAFGLRTSMGGNTATSRSPSPRTARAVRSSDASNESPGTSPTANASATTKRVQAELVAQGFENVRASIDRSAGGATMTVAYENRRYNRDELDALGIVMAVASHYAADSVPRIRVTILRRELAVLVVESGTAALSAFLDERATPAAFEQQLEIRNPRAGDARVGGEGSAASSRFKLDIFARPRVETAYMTELGPIEVRGTLLADAYLQLAPGIVLNARRTIGSAESSRFPFNIFPPPNGERLLLHFAAPLAMADRHGAAGAMTQLSVGQFGRYDVGFAEELDVPLADGLVSVGATVGVVGRSFQQLDRAIALAVGRVRYPALDLTASLTAGRFRNGDAGAAIELGRFFGQSEFTVFLKSTRYASQTASPLATNAGARLSLPLAPARELAPSRVRPRFPDLYSQTLQAAVVKQGEFGALRTDVARLLDTDHEIARAYRSRDRLQAVTIRQHVVAIRDGAKRWYRASQ
jgi:hypothetical protein